MSEIIWTWFGNISIVIRNICGFDVVMVSTLLECFGHDVDMISIWFGISLKILKETGTS